MWYKNNALLARSFERKWYRDWMRLIGGETVMLVMRIQAVAQVYANTTNHPPTIIAQKPEAMRRSRGKVAVTPDQDSWLVKWYRDSVGNACMTARDAYMYSPKSANDYSLLRHRDPD
jgi:hypothetical protein